MANTAKWIAFLIFIIIQLDSIFGNPERYVDSESIKVQLPRHVEELLSCTLEVRFLSGKLSNSFKLYDKKLSLHRNDMFKYVGKDDNNTCSFEILAYKLPEYFSYENGSPLTEEWTVHEQYVSDESWYETLASWLGSTNTGERKSDFYLHPQTFIEHFQMFMSSYEITRDAPYTNDTITIITQPRRYVIRKCTIFTSSNYFFLTGSENSNKIPLYNKRSSFSRSAETGVEFIGADDNTCSYRMYFKALEIKNENSNYFDINWRILEDYEETTFVDEKYPSLKPYSRLYSFFMPSISWWKNNNKSRLFIHDSIFKTTELEFF